MPALRRFKKRRFSAENSRPATAGGGAVAQDLPGDRCRVGKYF
jgi:hypothetical protein